MRVSCGSAGTRLTLEREAAAEQTFEREREFAFERERAEVMVERRLSALMPASTAGLWPPAFVARLADDD